MPFLLSHIAIYKSQLNFYFNHFCFLESINIKCTDCATYTFCNQLLAIRLSHSKWIIFYNFKYKLHWTNALKVRTWPGYTKITEKQEKKHVLCTFLIKLSVKVNCYISPNRYSHSTLLSRKMDWKLFISLKAIKHWKNVILKD